jgi:hypothetical protein
MSPKKEVPTFKQTISRKKKLPSAGQRSYEASGVQQIVQGEVVRVQQEKTV